MNNRVTIFSQTLLSDTALHAFSVCAEMVHL